MSLQFLMESLAKQRPEGQSPADWKALVEQRLEQPTMTLQNYGGERLNIVRQVKTLITRDGYAADAVVQVQSGAPMPLLIGTDLLPQLGFSFLQVQREGKNVDLLHMPEPEQSADCGRGTGPVTTALVEDQGETKPQGRGVVHLIQATRLLGRHMKLLRAHLKGLREQPLSLFEPECSLQTERGLMLAEAVTLPDVDDCVTLVIQNQASHTTRLRKGQVLGAVYPVSLCSSTAGEAKCAGEGAV